MEQAILIKDLMTKCISRYIIMVNYEMDQGIKMLLILKTEVVWCFVSALPRGAYEWCMNVILIIAAWCRRWGCVVVRREKSMKGVPAGPAH